MAMHFIWFAPALIRTFSNDTINPLAKSADFPLSTRPFTNLILKSGTPPTRKHFLLLRLNSEGLLKDNLGTLKGRPSHDLSTVRY